MAVSGKRQEADSFTPRPTGKSTSIILIYELPFDIMCNNYHDAKPFCSAQFYLIMQQL